MLPGFPIKKKEEKQSINKNVWLRGRNVSRATVVINKHKTALKSRKPNCKFKQDWQTRQEILACFFCCCCFLGGSPTLDLCSTVPVSTRVLCPHWLWKTINSYIHRVRGKWNVINDQAEGSCAGGGLQSDLQFLKSATTEEKNTECHCLWSKAHWQNFEWRFPTVRVDRRFTAGSLKMGHQKFASIHYQIY